MFCDGIVLFLSLFQNLIGKLEVRNQDSEDESKPKLKSNRKESPRWHQSTQKILETHVVGPMQCNCSIFACPTSKEAIVVDPGGDADVILDRIAKLGLKVRYVLITHGHFDHVLAARDIKEKTGAEVWPPP